MFLRLNVFLYDAMIRLLFIDNHIYNHNFRNMEENYIYRLNIL
jgi:hypothetical protein